MSFVMSMTVSDGNAHATEIGISTDVTGATSDASVEPWAEFGPQNSGQTGRVAWRSRGGHLAGQPEVDILARDLDVLHLVEAGRSELRDDGLDELLGRGGAGGEADDVAPLERLRLELALAVDQNRLGAVQLRDLDEALRVRARVGADHENQRRPPADHLLDRVLPVLRRVADVVGGRPLETAETIAERVDRL